VTGHLVGIYTCAAGGGPMSATDTARAEPGSGLAGDRYAAGAGTYSDRGGPGRDVTLVAREAIAAANDAGVTLGEHETRRNLVTECVDLDALVGETFSVGEVVLRGVRDCPPCAYLEKVTRAGVRAALEGRGGLRADVVAGGVIRVGDPIVLRAAPVPSDR
jgi:MOSC domain-containing protein YiiM